jgi:hypothetical protein
LACRSQIGDGRGGHILIFETGDPLPHMYRGDVAHPHRAELGQQVFADLVAVALPGGVFDW